MLHFISQFGILLIIIVIISFIVKFFKQPIIIGYVLSGLLFSAVLIKNYHFDGEIVVIMSELGITFLLFLMGLEFDLSSLKYLGKDIIISSLIQSVVFFAMGFGLSFAFGFGIMESVYIALLFMFASTLLVAKWLEDKKESTSLAGKITLGTLIIQDIFAILALTILGVVKEKSLIAIALSPLGALTLALVAFVLARYALNPLLKFASKYPELLFIFTLGVCFAFVELADILKFSTTIGAFIAGITLANTIYKNEISNRLRPLIVFFNMLFFVGLGFQMNLGLNLKYVLFLALLIILSLIVKPIVTYLTLRQRGYDMKTSFLTGLYLSQLSEFGTIIVASGLSLGLIGDLLLGSVAIISVIATMILSSYLIKYDKELYKFFEPYLLKFETKRGGKELVMEEKKFDYQVVFFGYYEVGKELVSKLQRMNKKIVVIENDPQNIALLEKEGIDYIYNSVNNPEFFEERNFKSVELVISGYHDKDENKIIVHEIKKESPTATIIVNAKSVKDSLELYKYGADYVIYQSYLNEQHVSVLLEDYATDIHKVLHKKIIDLEKLKKKDETQREIAKKDNVFWDIEHFVENVMPKVEPYYDKEEEPHKEEKKE